MPNGYHPVPGVQVVFISRTEPRHPRIEWSQSGSSFWAVSLVGGQAMPPDGALDYSWQGFDELVGAVQRVIRGHWSPKDARGSAIVLDFDQCSGHACGSFYVYGRSRGRTRVIHDHSLLRDPRFHPVDPSDSMALITTSGIGAMGLADAGEDVTRLDFAGYETILVTSFPLHFEECWPLEPLSSAVSVVLERPERRDHLLALWNHSVRR